MSVYFHSDSNTFYLSGGSVSYVMHVNEAGLLLNLYWGKRVPDGSVPFNLKSGYFSMPAFDMLVNRLPYELPVRGSGWYGTPAVSVMNAQGN